MKRTKILAARGLQSRNVDKMAHDKTTKRKFFGQDRSRKIMERLKDATATNEINKACDKYPVPLVSMEIIMPQANTSKDDGKDVYCESPLPPMAPETRKMMRLLEDDSEVDFSDDDSLKDPNFEQTYSSSSCNSIDGNLTKDVALNNTMIRLLPPAEFPQAADKIVAENIPNQEVEKTLSKLFHCCEANAQCLCKEPPCKNSCETSALLNDPLLPMSISNSPFILLKPSSNGDPTGYIILGNHPDERTEGENVALKAINSPHVVSYPLSCENMSPYCTSRTDQEDPPSKPLILSSNNDQTTNVNLNAEIDQNNENENMPDTINISDITPASIRDNESTGDSISEGRPKKGRKRRLGQYDRKEMKKRKYSNLPYTNSKKRKIEAKQLIDFDCKCSSKCRERVSVEKREMEFKKYNGVGSYNGQILYIAACVRENPKKRSYTTSSGTGRKKKEYSRTYSLSGVNVCRQMFVGTLQTNPQKITSSLNKMRSGEEVLRDKRGESQGGWNKTCENDIKLVTEHIKSLPKYESHYSRENTNALYLKTGMTVRKMYYLYEKEIHSKLGENYKCVSFSVYKKIFLGKFNLRTKKIKKDTCNKCDAFTIAEKNATPEEAEKIKILHSKHQEFAENARKMMNSDLERAQKDVNFECLTFDLEKTLPLPRIPSNIIFYKRQLWLYNSGIHAGSNDKGYFYVWAEGEAGRGAQEVGSCLIKHIETYLKKDVKYLTLWSDTCGGQNRNIKLTLMLISVLNVHPTLLEINHKFLESGHSFLPNDTDFSKVETELKMHERIYTVDQYINVMKYCKKKNPNVVVKMTKNDFFSSECLENMITNRKHDKNKNKISWLQTKEICLRKQSPGSIFMRKSFNEEFVEVDVKKCPARGRPAVFDPKRDKLKLLWPDGKDIAPAKLKDLKSVYHLIPKDCLDFYKKLKGNNNIVDDLDGFGGIPDFEVEEVEDSFIPVPDE